MMCLLSGTMYNYINITSGTLYQNELITICSPWAVQLIAVSNFRTLIINNELLIIETLFILAHLLSFKMHEIVA